MNAQKVYTLEGGFCTTEHDGTAAAAAVRMWNKRRDRIDNA